MSGRAARRMRDRLVLSARLIVVEHWPSDDGMCPICKVTDCSALATACAYLDLVDDSFVPARPAADVVDLGSRANPPSTEATTGGKPADGEPADGKPADGKPADGKPADGGEGKPAG